MKILLALKCFDFGGTENHVCDLANSLSEIGHDVFVLAGKGRQVLRLNPKVIFLPYQLSDFFFPINIIYVFYLLKKYDIDVIHAHQRIAIFYSAIASKLTKTPLITTVHGRTRLDLRSKFSRNASDRIIFVSNHVLQISACYEQIKSKSVVIPNGVEVIYGCNSAIPYSITYVSRLDKKHSKVILMIIQEVLPKLLFELPQVTFNIIGEGKGIKRVVSEAEKLNVKMNRKVCNILGFQPEVKGLFKKSTLVLGVGRVALEALACGVPVLSINQKRLGAIITPSNYTAYKVKNFIAVHSNQPTPYELITIIIDFFKNITRCYDETKLIQDHINKEFNNLILTSRIVDVYFDAINSKKKRNHSSLPSSNTIKPKGE